MSTLRHLLSQNVGKSVLSVVFFRKVDKKMFKMFHSRLFLLLLLGGTSFGHGNPEHQQTPSVVSEG